MNSGIYLDNNATTQPLPEVVAAVENALNDQWRNPSSGYASANVARESIDICRDAVASLVGGIPSEWVTFTSGGTEANNLGIWAAIRSGVPGRNRFVTSAIEHASVLSMIPQIEEHGVECIDVSAESSGQVDLNRLLEAIDEKTIAVSLQWVNNETGVVQPIKEVAAKCKAVGCAFHIDAAQAIGRLPSDFVASGADYLTFTGHKIHAPKGVGVLICRNPRSQHSLLAGGGQEFGFRPGTENTPGLAGLEVAARLRLEKLGEVAAQMRSMRDIFEDAILRHHPNVQINGDPGLRCSNTSNLLFPAIDGAALVNRLDLQGIECSQSSACTHARPEPSHVLRAMGLSEEEAYSSIRFSFSELNTLKEAKMAADTVATAYSDLRHATLKLVA